MIQGFQMASSPELASAINALLSDDATHMRMAPTRPATTADSGRAAEIVKTARAGLSKYADVKVAEQNGYVKFLPWLEEQSIFHYNNISNVLATLGTFDATKPVSLLYKKNDKGQMALVGAMYAAVPNATPADLDARLPTSIAHWHEPWILRTVRRFSAPRRAESSTARARALAHDQCAPGLHATGGRFVPRIFGWMAHVYLFAGDDRKSSGARSTRAWTSTCITRPLPTVGVRLHIEGECGPTDSTGEPP